MKRLSTYLLAGIALLSASCSDFLDTAPKDALSPATTWKTETDAESFVVGCYNGLLDPSSILYLDCGSDIGYNNFHGKDGVLGETVPYPAVTQVLHSMICHHPPL